MAKELATVGKEALINALDERIGTLCEYMSQITEDDQHYDTTLDSLVKLTKCRNEILRFEEDISIQVQEIELERKVKSKELDLKERELNIREAEVISANENGRKERIVRLIIAGVSFIGLVFEGGIKLFGLTTGYNAELRNIYPSSSTFNEARRELYSPFRNKVR